MDGELIRSDPAVMMGKPVVAGTRITVEILISAGETIDQILEAHRLLGKAFWRPWISPLKLRAAGIEPDQDK